MTKFVFSRIDDFDTHYIVDRNLQTSLQIVDGNPEDFPLLSDPFKNAIPGDLEHTSLSLEYKSSERGPLTVEQLLGSKNVPQDRVVKSM